jgi:nitrate reductase delta subunit
MPASFELMRSHNRRSRNGDAIDRVATWTRARFALAEDETVMVSEVSCAVPGCPPIETHVVFWTALGRHHFKVFKPLAEVVEGDLPPAFMKNALVALDGIDCNCC